MSIYAACAGDSIVNGIYDETSGGWQKRGNSNIVLYFDNILDEWQIIQYPNNDILYKYTLQGSSSAAAGPVSENDWIAVNGSSPAVKTYQFNSAVITTLIVTGAGSSDVNGTYTYQNSVHVNYNTGSGQYVSGYLHSSGAYIITADGSSVWAIQFVPSFGGSPVYSSTVVAGSVPVDTFFKDTFDTGTDPAPTVSVDDSIFCGVTTGIDNKFVYTKNNIQYIRYNGQAYIRS